MTITIELLPDTEKRLRADAEAQGQDPAALVQTLVESAYPPQPRRRLSELAGFAAHTRQDDKMPDEIVREMRSEWDHRP